MASITKLKTSQSIQFFDHSAALNLVQAFHRHLDLADLLGLLYSQAAAMLDATGMHYRNTDDAIDIEFGSAGRHTANYNLIYQDENLGEVLFSFENRVTEDTLTTAEDLIVLAMSPVKNALAYRQISSPEHVVVTEVMTHPQTAVVDPAHIVKPGNDDTLVLVGLDGIAETRSSNGEAWAQTLIQAMQTQIRDGLQEANRVYQIDDELLAVLLPRTTPEAAANVARKLRVLIACLHLKDGAITTQLTACMGIAGTQDATTAEKVLDNARAALHLAQTEGFNTIRHHQIKEPA